MKKSTISLQSIIVTISIFISTFIWQGFPDLSNVNVKHLVASAFKRVYILFLLLSSYLTINSNTGKCNNMAGAESTYIIKQ